MLTSDAMHQRSVRVPLRCDRGLLSHENLKVDKVTFEVY